VSFKVIKKIISLKKSVNKKMIDLMNESQALNAFKPKPNTSTKGGSKLRLVGKVHLEFMKFCALSSRDGIPKYFTISPNKEQYKYKI